MFEQIRAREQDARKHIHPQQDYADLCVRYYSDDKFAPGAQDVLPSVKLQMTVDANVHHEQLTLSLAKHGVPHAWDYLDDLKSQYLNVNAEPVGFDFDHVARSTIRNFTDVFPQQVRFASGYTGLIQLVVLIILQSCTRGDVQDG